MGYRITKKFHDRKVREINETIECLENNHASLVQSIEENHREELAAKDGAISIAKQLCDKRKVEIDQAVERRELATSSHDAVRERLRQILDQIRKIPVDADREYILRSIGLIEGIVGEIANTMPILSSPQMTDGVYRDVHYYNRKDLMDHCLDAARYWTQPKPKATDRI